MRAMFRLSLFAVIGCAEVAPDAGNVGASQGAERRATRDPAALRDITSVTPLSKSRVAELLARHLHDEGYRESRRATAAQMADRDLEIIAKLALPRAEAQRFAEILSEHRAAKLEVQGLVTAMATAGVSREDRHAAIQGSAAFEKARPGYVSKRVREAFGEEKAAAYERTRDELLDPARVQPARISALRPDKALEEAAR